MIEIMPITTVSALARRGYRSSFDDEGCVITRKGKDEVLFSAPLEDEMYRLVSTVVASKAMVARKRQYRRRATAPETMSLPSSIHVIRITLNTFDYSLLGRSLACAPRTSQQTCCAAPSTRYGDWYQTSDWQEDFWLS